MKSVFVVLSLIVAVACAHKLTPCGRFGNRTYVVDYPFAWQKFNGERENPANVYPDSSRCKGSKYRLCIVSNANSPSYDDNDPNTFEYSCAQCRTTCDCPSGYYCSNSDSESDDFGKCLSYKHKVGSFCNIAFGDPQNLMITKNSTTSGNNNQLFSNLYTVATASDKYCAIFRRHRDIGTRYEDYDVFSIEWMGACIFNRCYACNSYYMNYKYDKPYAYDNVIPDGETFDAAYCPEYSAFDYPKYSINKETTRVCYHNKISNGPKRL